MRTVLSNHDEVAHIWASHYKLLNMGDCNMPRNQVYNGVFVNGNAKIGKDTIISNMQSATDCISFAMGLCQFCTWAGAHNGKANCYAFMAELLYPIVLPFRRRQAEYWATRGIDGTIKDLRPIFAKSRIKYFRFNESGDFPNQRMVCHLKVLARTFPDITFYGYTARKDLSFRALPINLSVNGSGWRRGRQNRFNVVKDYTGRNARCAGNCRVCCLCKTARGMKIEVKKH